jgi:hypothetical protein
MTKAKLNARVFDAMLELVCEEIADEQLSEWETLEQDHIFSPEFEQKMKQLLREQTRKLRRGRSQRVLRRVAVAVLAVMAVGFTFTMSVSAARIEVLNAVRQFAEEYISFTFRGDKSQPADGVLRPSYLPEGYQEKKMTKTSTWVRVIYEDAQNTPITFYQRHKTDTLNVQLDGEHSKASYEVEINNTLVQVYESVSEEYASFLTWETDLVFYELHGYVQPTELIRMVESMN